MKRIFLFLAILLSCGVGYAQPLQHVVDRSISRVPDVVSSTNQFPINGAYTDRKNLHSQLIYRAAWIEPLMYSRISKITFHTSGDFDYNTSVEVKLMATTAYSLVDNFVNINSIAPPVAVYNGNLSFANGLMEFNFDTPLKYMGGNLLVNIVITATGGAMHSVLFAGGTLYDNGDYFDQEVWRNDPEYTVARYFVPAKGQEGAKEIRQTYFPQITFDYTPFVVHKLAASATSNGSLSPEGTLTADTTIIEQGDSLTYTFKADSCYRIGRVLIDGVNDPEAVQRGAYTFRNVQKSSSIHVEFERIPYTIAATTNIAHGSISPSGDTVARHGDTVRFTIKADTTHDLVDVLVDGVSTPEAVQSGTYTFYTITAPHSIQAVFNIKTYTLTPSVNGGHGSISPAAPLTVNHGDDKRFDFTPDEDYQIAKVLVDGVANHEARASGSYTLERITQDHSVEVFFELDTFVITSSVSGSNGTISPSGATTVSLGDKPTVYVGANEGYSILRLEVDSSERVTAAEGERFYQYTFNSIAENHTITAWFAESEAVAPCYPDTVYIFDTIYIPVVEYVHDTIYIGSTDVNGVTQSGITVYPNPVVDKLYIQSPAPVKQVRIFDMRGRLVKAVYSDVHEVDVRELITGTYLVLIQTDRATVPIKVLKQ